MMDRENEMKILNDLVTNIYNDIILSLEANGRKATGKTAEALQVVQNGFKVELEAPGYIDILETGRGPTSPDAPPGNPTVFEMIKEWCAAKGIDEKFAYPITQKIHKEGYAGRPGLLSNPLSDDNVDKRATEAAGALADLLITSYLKI